MRARTLAVAGLTTLTLAGCGSTGGTATGASGSPAASSAAPSTPAGNGEAAKTGPQVAADAADALVRAGAVHMVGTGTSDGQPLSVDLHLQGADASGTVTMAGQPLEIITTAGQAYAKAPAAFWTAQQVPASTARELDGRWVVLPAEAASTFGEFSLTRLADQLRTPDGAAWKVEVQRSSAAGGDVVVITDSDGSTTQVAATGEPYPLQSTDKGADAGTVTLSDFGTKVAITAPPAPLDLQELGA
jgi:hypothetical protein